MGEDRLLGVRQTDPKRDTLDPTTIRLQVTWPPTRTVLFSAFALSKAQRVEVYLYACEHKGIQWSAKNTPASYAAVLHHTDDSGPD